MIHRATAQHKGAGEGKGLEQVYKLKEQEVEVLLKAVSTSNVLFTSGYASYLEVITAQKSVLEAELELANIKKGIFIRLSGCIGHWGGRMELELGIKKSP